MTEINITEIEKAKDQISKQIQNELANQLRRIPSLVEEALTGAVLSILGIRKTGNGYDVDSWSRSPLNSYIKDKVHESMVKHAGPLVDAELSRLTKLKTLPRSIAEASVRQSEYAFTSAVKDTLDNALKQLAKKYSEKVREFVDSSLKENINLDIMDPNSYEGILGEVLLEEQARLMAKKES